ncbi:MAG: anthranilate synthase component I family protein [Flavobacteriales bacterium]|nr:anthranilate synthase component I family protein [Flavobacteriales bacterium]
MAYRFHKEFSIEFEEDQILKRAISYGRRFENFALFVTHEGAFTFYAGSERSIKLDQTEGAFEKLKKFHESSSREICGVLGYDLKNDLEDLSSRNPSTLSEPESSFFEVDIRVEFDHGEIRLSSVLESDGENFWENFNQNSRFEHLPITDKPVSTVSKDEYLKKSRSLQRHIQRGDIYEANYCIEFSVQASGFDPYAGFYSIWKKTMAPFSVFAKLDSLFILSGSPERYLKREGSKLISQPIKGTAKRSIDPILDDRSKFDLRNDQKEQSENVMIVDLVRNDLSRVASKGSVRVSELFGIRTFKTVHHLVSTIEAELDHDRDSWDAIKETFPMGSMTGAPKISAMKLVEEHEKFKRGVYSGAFGVIKPSGNFDFNVLIRTLVFERTSSKITFGVGSAITIMADPQKEWNECMLKADALMKSLRDPDHEPKREIHSQP